MSRRVRSSAQILLVVFCALFVLSAVVQTTYAQTAAKPIKLTYALFQPATAALSKLQVEYAKEIEKRSNGRVQITVFQGGALLGAPAMFQGIKNGIADMGNGVTSYNPGNFPFTSIAELPTDAGSGWACSYAQYDFLTKYQPREWNDVHLLTSIGAAADVMAIGTGKKPIHKLEDMKGKSIRTNHADITSALGATVKDVPMADVYDSVSKGVLDGVQATLEPFKSWRLGDVSKYLTVNTAPSEPGIIWYNAMNKNKWNSLPPDIQKVFTDVSREYIGKLGLAWDDQGVAGLEYTKSQGASIYILPKDEAARWQAAIMPVIDARLKKLSSQGFNQKEVTEAWNYFKSRVTYWNGQQAKNNVTPLLQRLEKAAK